MVLADCLKEHHLPYMSQAVQNIVAAVTHPASASAVVAAAAAGTLPRKIPYAYAFNLLLLLHAAFLRCCFSSRTYYLYEFSACSLEGNLAAAAGAAAAAAAAVVAAVAAAAAAAAVMEY